jgi:hypothetical protein
MNRDEGKKLGTEDVPKLQDHSAQGSAACNLQEPQAQTAPGVRVQQVYTKGAFLWRE